ncbi:hypothetical protein [Hymenobacter aerophilus]|uniref:hypothetical protein n=1 Tax=Hymenobacter aerophilus TaxID=119644 RepID=UPI00037DFC12|nr:hypothetical protein [Hymenobacter aerophilus]
MQVAVKAFGALFDALVVLFMSVSRLTGLSYAELTPVFKLVYSIWGRWAVARTL